MKKIILLVAAAIISITALSAQDYKWAAGMRGGGQTWGFTAKHKFTNANALEVILGVPYKDGFVVTGLYQWHIPVITDGFHFFYGAGAHTGSWNHKFSIGIDAIAGLEYKIPNAPVAFSVDYKPAFNIASRTRFYMGDIAGGIKFTF